jgi:hypothetical protein
LKNCTVKMKNYRKYYYYKIHEQGSWIEQYLKALRFDIY